MVLFPLPPSILLGNCSVGWKEVKGDLGASCWWVGIGNWPRVEQPLVRSPTWRLKSTWCKREERRIHSLPARQLLTPVSPVLGWGRLDTTFILLSECFICPPKWEIGVEGGVWVGGGDLIQPVGGELAHWVTSTCSFFWKVQSLLFLLSFFLPSLIVKTCFSSPLDRSGPLPPYFPVVLLLRGFMWEWYVT